MKNKAFLPTLAVATIQYYDYYLYGLMAAILSRNFFTNQNLFGFLTPLMQAYLVLSIGMFARPIGAVILGRIGDLYGRTATLRISLIGNSVFSFIIAFIPPYEMIGHFAALILLICKMCVNVFSSAGTDGVRLYIYENIGREKQCFGNGLVIMATQIGSLIASFSVWLFTIEYLPDYFWRSSFIIGGVFGVLATYFLAKKEYATEVKKEDVNENLNIFEVIRTNKLLLLICAILAGCIGASYQFNIIFFGTYCFEVLKIVDASKMRIYTSFAITIYMVFAIISGAVADHYGRRKILMIVYPLLLMAVCANTVEIANNSFNPAYYFMGTLCIPFIIIPSLSFLKQSIPISIRYRLFSLAHSIGSIVISSTTPFISTSLYQTTKINWLPSIYFVVIISTIVLTVNLLCTKFKANDY